MADRIQLRRDTSTNWVSANPVLAAGEQGFETDTLKLKIGNGVTAWNSLAYVIDTSAFATSADVTAAVSALVDSAPGALDTLNELAAALGDDADFVTTVTNSLALKANTADLATVATTGAYSDLTGTPTLPSALTDLSITDGTAGQVLSADGDGTYTFIDAASGGGGSFEAVASGSLSDGSTVILNADGTVSVVAVTEVTVGFASPSVFESDSMAWVTATFDSANNKIVIAYRDNANSNYGTAIVGTVSGTSISFGTPVVFESGFTEHITATFDSNSNKIVIAYRNSSSKGECIVGTVSGTSISFGTSVEFYNSNTMYPSATFDSNSNKIVIAYRAGTTYGNAVVGTVSGTSISFGTPAVFESAGVEYISATFDSANNKIVIAYRDDGNSRYGTAVVGTVSGTDISFGTPVVFAAVESWTIGATFDSANNKIVIVYKDFDTRYGRAAVGTVSGTSISFGTLVTFDSVQPYEISVFFDSTNNKIVIAYRSSTGGHSVKMGTVSGTSISFESKVSLGTSGGYIASTFDSNSNKFVIAYPDSGNSNYGTAVVYSPVGESITNLTAENYAGIADAAYSDAATATIQTAGSVDDAQSGLTPGQAYYVQPDGTLGLNPATPSVFAGTAVSATSLLIGKEAPAADLSSYATETYVDTAVSNLVDTAPDALNTLNELAAALNDDADFAGTVTTSLAAKANTADLATVATTGAYSDLTGTPTIPADVSDLTDTTSLLGGGGGSFEAVASGSISDGAPAILNSNGTVAAVAQEATSSLLQTLNNPNAYDTSASDQFGMSVAVSGNYAIVGAYYEDDASGTNSGKAYIYNATTGALLHTLNNPNAYGTSTNDYFGQSVAISGNYAIVGAYGEGDAGGTQSGKAYIFNVTTGALVHTLDNPNAYSTSAGDRFGQAVAISSNYAIVGAFLEADAGGNASGKAYIFDVTTGALVHTLNNPNSYGTSFNDRFGYTVGLSGNYAIVAASEESEGASQDDNSGKVYIFDVTTGALVRTIFNPNAYGTSASDQFGESLAVSGDYAIVGTIREADAGGTYSGKAYIFNITTGALLQTLDNPNAFGTSDNDQFSISVAISGNYAIVGAYYEDDAGGTESGKAYIFNVTTGALVHTYDNPNPYSTSAGDYFGRSVAISDNYVIVGAYGEDEGGDNSGKAYIFNVPAVTTNLTAENYAGIANAAYADAATATIQTAGSVDDAQSGLTPGQAYYVQEDGTLGLTPGTPSVFAGTAVSATKLLIGKSEPATTVTLSDLAVTATAEQLNTITTKLGTDSVIDGGTV